TGYPPHDASVGEVAGGYLVHGDGGQRRAVEGLEPLLLLLGRPRRIGRGDVVPGRGVGLVGAGPRHHGERPPPGGGRRPDPAFPVETGNQVVLVGEGDGFLHLLTGFVDDAVGVGVVGEQGLDDLADGDAGADATAGLVELGAQAV